MNTQVESQTQNGSDILVEWMRKKQIPVSLSNYLLYTFPDIENPTLDDLDAEQIEMIPEELLKGSSK